MKDSSIKDDFRAWVRMELSERVGEDHRKVAQLYFPVKDLMEIAIYEIWLYIMQHGWRAPGQNTADITDVHVNTVRRVVKKRF